MTNTIYSASSDRYNSGMKYRRCGKSGILLPEISLGLWHNFGDANTFANSQAMAHYAFNQGITHFDLANNYGPPCGSAEETFGMIMKKSFMPYRDELFISTKAGHEMWAGPYGDWGSRKSLISSLNQSLKRMHLDYVDIFYTHRYDPNTPLEETLQTLVDIVRQGKALYIGISKYPKDKAEFAYKYLEERDVHCLLYQGRYNLFSREPENEGILQQAKENGTGFIAFSPLAQGLLTNRYLNGIPEGSRIAQGGFLKKEALTDETLGKIKALNEIALQRGQTLAEMALAWLLKDDMITSVIIGASSVAQLNNNLQSLGNTVFTVEELEKINRICNPE
ncbi:aldo/keto reductase [uncultured Bacteroides sp.]|uniref:aldo/keto reductase n=1 Tax=uncultured Bacteroides sp. TaxID=162156 RepID=UPI0025E55F99|nr:aldo/keto reductase [uncultured Bacteroides sp.]